MCCNSPGESRVGEKRTPHAPQGHEGEHTVKASQRPDNLLANLSSLARKRATFCPFKVQVDGLK